MAIVFVMASGLRAFKGYCRQLTTEQLIAEIDTPAG
jgi:hypothetical protein